LQRTISKTEIITGIGVAGVLSGKMVECIFRGPGKQPKRAQDVKGMSRKRGAREKGPSETHESFRYRAEHFFREHGQCGKGGSGKGAKPR